MSTLLHGAWSLFNHLLSVGLVASKIDLFGVSISHG